MRDIAGYGRRHSRAYPLTGRLAGKRAMMMMLTAMPVGLSVALGLGSALSISLIKTKSCEPSISEGSRRRRSAAYSLRNKSGNLDTFADILHAYSTTYWTHRHRGANQFV